MNLNLQNNIFSRQDLKSASLEIQKYTFWFGQASVKKQVLDEEAGGPPPLSAAAADLLNQWHAKQAVSKQSLDELLKKLDQLDAELPGLTVTLAAPAPRRLKEEVVKWFHQNVRDDLLVDFKFDAT